MDVDNFTAAGLPSLPSLSSVKKLLDTAEGVKDNLTGGVKDLYNSIKDHIQSKDLEAFRQQREERDALLKRKIIYKVLPSNFANLVSDVLMKNILKMHVQKEYVTQKDFSSSELATVKKATHKRFKK